MASELRLLRSTDWKPLNEGEYNSDSDIDDNDLNTGDANDDDENEVKEAKLVDVDVVENEKPVDNNDDNDDKNNNNNNIKFTCFAFDSGGSNVILLCLSTPNGIVNTHRLQSTNCSSTWPGRR